MTTTASILFFSLIHDNHGMSDWIVGARLAEEVDHVEYKFQICFFCMDANNILKCNIIQMIHPNLRAPIQCFLNPKYI